MTDFKKITKNFPKVKVLVVGDLMLDRYLWGNVSRISPEAPVPIVHVRESSTVVGGAANVAANIKGLQAEAYLFGLIGDDAEGRIFAENLRRLNISPDFLFSSKERRTTVKTRIVAHNQHVVRIDEENTSPISQNEAEQIFGAIEKTADLVDIVVISDYAKGLLTENLLARLITFLNGKNKKVLVDPKGNNFSKYKGATMLTPNRREAAESCNIDVESVDLEKKAGERLFENLCLDALLITQGEKGMTLLEKNKKAVHLNAFTRKVYDVTGAGDTVIAGLAVGLAAGGDYYESAFISNVAAGLVVEQVGTTTVNFNALENALVE